METFRTTQTYKTRARAIKKLESALAAHHATLGDVHWLIAVNEEGRFGPVVVGADNVALCHDGITVVG